VQGVGIDFETAIPSIETIRPSRFNFDKKHYLSVVAGMTRRYAQDSGIHNPQIALDDSLPSLRVMLSEEKRSRRQ